MGSTVSLDTILNFALVDHCGRPVGEPAADNLLRDTQGGYKPVHVRPVGDITADKHL